MHQRFHRYIQLKDYVPGHKNRLADDASRRLLHHSNANFLSHFSVTYPQKQPWLLYRPQSFLLRSWPCATRCICRHRSFFSRHHCRSLGALDHLLHVPWSQSYPLRCPIPCPIPPSFCMPIPARHINTSRHPVCSRTVEGETMTLLCAKVDTDQIRLIGRWRSDEMLQYLHVQAEPIDSPIIAIPVWPLVNTQFRPKNTFVKD